MLVFTQVAAQMIVNLLVYDHCETNIEEYTLAAGGAENHIQVTSTYAPHSHWTNPAILDRLHSISSFCSQQQI